MPNRLTKGQALVGALDLTTLAIGGTNVTATAAELNRAADASARMVAVTAATLTITEATHDGKVILLNRAGGIAVTLPAATGNGTTLRFVLQVAVTTPSTTIKVVGDDTMIGGAYVRSDGAAAVLAYAASGTDDTVTLDGTTTGGLAGDSVTLIDVAADLWYVLAMTKATGTEATPFSATVS